MLMHRVDQLTASYGSIRTSALLPAIRPQHALHPRHRQLLKGRVHLLW
jgi:hypothetical protein